MIEYARRVIRDDGSYRRRLSISRSPTHQGERLSVVVRLGSHLHVFIIWRVIDA